MGSPNLIDTILASCVFLGPFVGYYLMLQREDRTPLRLILAAAIGSGLPAALWGIGASMTGMSLSTTIPWAFFAIAYGAFIGLCGILARTIGAWLSRRQP